MIERDPRRAASAERDLIVVGGGVYGVTLALEAARRGLRPVLVERGDFGGETSWNSLRIVHGGLRYLQTLDLPRFRESIAERRWLLSRFPDLVRPLPCLMPLYGRGLRRPAVLRLALAANDLLSRGRNAGVPAGRQLPRGRLLSVAETVELCPSVARAGLRGAALWHDGAMPDSQRLLIEMLRWAVACGAVALNYVEARRLLTGGRALRGIEALDRPTGRTLELRAPLVVNCAGPWCRDVALRFDRDLPELFRRSVAVNVLLDRPAPGPAAVAVAGGRGGTNGTYFLHPWKGKILAGTHHAPWRDAYADAGIPEELWRPMLAAMNAALPEARFRPEEVLRVHWGLLPARAEGTDRLAVRSLVVHHADRGGPAGLFSVSGIKFTTARREAVRTLERIHGWLGRALPPPAGTPRPDPAAWIPLERFERLLEDEPAGAADHARRLCADEAVLHLDDLLLRRTDWGTDPRRGAGVGRRVAALLAWPEARIAAELERLVAARS